MIIAKSILIIVWMVIVITMIYNFIFKFGPWITIDVFLLLSGITFILLLISASCEEENDDWS